VFGTNLALCHEERELLGRKLIGSGWTVFSKQLTCQELFYAQD